MEISMFYVQKVYGNLYLFFSRLNTLLKETEQNYNKVQDPSQAATGLQMGS